MIVYLVSAMEISSLKLSDNVKGNYWLKYKDETGDYINLLNVEVDGESYFAKSNNDAKIEVDGKFVKMVELKKYYFYIVRYKNNVILLYSMPSNDETFNGYIINSSEITIGKAQGNTIVYRHPLVNDVHAKIDFNNNVPIISLFDERLTVYVNKKKVNQRKIKVGDSIFIFGLRIIYVGKFWLINNPNSLVAFSSNVQLYKRELPKLNNVKSDNYLVNYNESDYYEKSPRFITEFEHKRVIIDAPPAKKEDQDIPLILTIGPMMTMSLTSMITVWQTVNRMIDGASLKDSLPSLVMSVVMIITLIMWPIISARFQKKLDKKKEEARQEKYKNYLMRKAYEIRTLMSRQKQVLIENNVPLEECQVIIFNKKRNLWEKEIYQKDFMTIRLGIGSIKPDIEIVYPEDHFTMSDDNLLDLLSSTVQRQELINEVPIKISLTEKNVSAVIGTADLTNKFFESILLQLMTFQSYRDLKIVILKSDEDNDMDYMKLSPHIFSDDMSLRFYGDNYDDVEQISNYLTRIFDSRRLDMDGKISDLDYKNFSTYYLIIADNDLRIKRTSIINRIINSSVNVGFTVLFRGKNLSSLPKECRCFITIDGDNGKTSGYFENELVAGKQQAFKADLNVQNRVDISKCVEELSKIPMRSGNAVQRMPNSISFLEMYNVGKVEHLNIEHRWNNNDPTVSLSVPIGVDLSTELFKLDLHEKRHGPHGLIAGMTGSGKSEFIITYVLSMAINYHPYEVSFVLIDYKGGGLTGAFENLNNGFVLPHLAGTITNLDDSTMNRALASIRAELERRQRLFKEARERLGESTLDIYKYQRLYREGKVDKPVSHLLIISDEFAELKQQKPEFMQELISAARIGRSLGVHLILATQKPSGIVDEQIWSNSKFKICLKVQDRTDSMDVIGRPDAALLSDVGRFFLQVGYNEYFALGQSAYSGAPYYPEENKKKKVSTSIDFIDSVGNIIKSVDNNVVTVKPQGEEVTNIVKHLIDIANDNNIHINKLWLDKLRNIIYYNDLKNKYDYLPEKGIINPIIGEFDDPKKQRQGLLTLPLSKDGNAIIYGMVGSGKLDLLTTMIYSIINSHDASEVNIYVLDFGAESLRIFINAPQVGDVITSDMAEKVENIFKYLNGIIEERKKLLSKYNGDFNLYNTKEGYTLPTIVVIINNYEAFAEEYDDYNEQFGSISRDCQRYGIVFVISVSATTAVRYKISQNFKQVIPLQLNDKLDYRTLVGKTDVFPSEIVGRGIVQLDDVYEFQTALVSEREKQNDDIEALCNELVSKSSIKAKPIPVLPDKITVDSLVPYIGKPVNGYYPVGIYKNDLGIATTNFVSNFVTLVSSNDEDLFPKFINPLIKLLQTDCKVTVIDSIDIVKNDNTYSYYNTKFDEVFDGICTSIDNLYNIYSSNNYDLSKLDNIDKSIVVITGIGSLLSKVSNKDKFIQSIQKASEIKKILFVFVDTDSKFKNIEYDDWFKASVNTSHGIWLGNNINDQLTIKINKNAPEGKMTIPSNFGFLITKGVPKYTKLLEDDVNGKQNIS